MATLPHIALTAAGTLGAGGGNEIWSCSMKFGIEHDGTFGLLQAPTQEDVDALILVLPDAWKAFITAGTSSISSLFSSWVAVTQVKAAAKLSTGHDDPAVSVESLDISSGNRGGTAAGTGVTNQAGENPYPVALAITTRGDTYLRGSAAYGRFYLPCPNLHVDPTGTAYTAMVDGLMDAASVTAFANAAVSLIHDINAVALPSGHNGYLANIGATTDLAGVRSQQISAVTVDNRPDTIRRRSNAISGRGVVRAAV